MGGVPFFLWCLSKAMSKRANTGGSILGRQNVDLSGVEDGIAANKTSITAVETDVAAAKTSLDTVEAVIPQIMTAVTNVNTSLNTVMNVYTNAGINFQSSGQSITFPDGTSQTTAPAAVDTTELLSRTATTSQSIASHVTTAKNTFDSDQQLITKKYVDDKDYVDSNSSVLFTDATISSNPQSVMIGKSVGTSHDGYNQGMNTFIGAYSGQGGQGRFNTFIGRGVGMNIQGSENCYIGYPKTNTTESQMLRIGGAWKELMTGKVHSTGHYLRFNTNHLECDVANVPTSYSSTHADRIWNANGVLMVGNNTAPSGGSSTLVGLTDVAATAIASGKFAIGTGSDPGPFSLDFTTNQIQIDGGGIKCGQINPLVHDNTNLGDGSNRWDMIHVRHLNNGTNLAIPTDAGTAGHVLTTDGSGTMSWAAAGGGGSSLSFTPLFEQAYRGSTDRNSLTTILSGSFNTGKLEPRLFNGNLANEDISGWGTGWIAWKWADNTARCFNELTIWVNASASGSASDSLRSTVLKVYGSNDATTATNGTWVHLNSTAQTVWLAEAIASKPFIWWYGSGAQNYPQGWTFRLTTNMNNYKCYRVQCVGGSGFSTSYGLYDFTMDYKKIHEVDYS